MLSEREAATAAELAAAFGDAEVEGELTPRELEAQVEALSSGLVAIERRDRLDLELEAAVARSIASLRKEAEARAERDRAAGHNAQLDLELRQLLLDRGFPVDLSADAALELWNDAVLAKQRLGDLEVELTALATDEAQSAQSADSLVIAARQAGLQVAGPEQAEHAATTLLEQRAKAEAERKQLLERSRAVEAQVARALRQCDERAKALEALLERGGAATAEEFLTRAEQAKAFAAAEGRSRELSARVAARTGLSAHAAQEQLARLGGTEAAGQLLATRTAALSALDLERNQLREALGSLRERLRALECDEAIAALRAEEERLVAAASELAAQYAADRIALALLQRARRQFEQEQQPRVIQLASALFAELTGARYVRVYLPAGGKELCIRDEGGREWSAEQLSRGTREQLYLAFRLAVIEDFGDARLPLPIIVDDILVNFDPVRTLSALKVLARFSRRHQVIAFTCHLALRELFRAEGAHVVEVAPRPLTLLAPPEARESA